MAKSHPVKGSNNTSKIPRPNPIKHTPKVLLNKLNIKLPPFLYNIKLKDKV